MGDDDTVDENQNRARNEGADRNTFERDALRFAEIVDEYKKAEIDPLQCVGCDVCQQICPKNAIGKVEK